MKRISHKKYGDYVLKDLTQGDVEDFVERLKQYPESTPAQVYRRAVVQCAIASQWFDPPITDELLSMNPGRISWLAENVNRYFIEVITPDEEKEKK